MVRNTRSAEAEIVDSGHRRVALVTGGAKGIGRAISDELARVGYLVVVSGRDMRAVDDCVNSICGTYGSDRADGLAMDVSSGESVNSAFSTLVSRHPVLHALVNNAGTISRAPAESHADDDWARVIETDLSGVFRTCRSALPLLRSAGSSAIVNVSSIGSFVGIEGRVGYCSAKAGVDGLTRTLAMEWGSFGIRVNSLAPGWTQTSMVEAGIAGGVLDGERLALRTALSRLAEPTEIAQAAAFLLSDSASYVTGSVLVADGGYSINGSA